jgi:hypothetical protein
MKTNCYFRVESLWKECIIMDMFSCFLQTQRADYTERPCRVGGETQGP